MNWQPIGPGGGGGHFYPSISPADPNVMVFSCDMGGINLSKDGAATWRMLPGHIARKLQAYPAFDPGDPDVIYLPCFRGLLVTRDGGETWERALGKEIGYEHRPYSCGGVTVDPSNPATVIVGFSRFESEAGAFAFLSRNRGRNWDRIPGWPEDVSADRLYFDPTTPPGARVLYAQGADGVKRSQDWGQTWQTLRTGLPGDRITSFAAAWGATGGSVFFVTVPGSIQNDRYVGGIFRSTDLGKTWEESGEGLYRGTRVSQARRGRPGAPIQYHELTMGVSNTRLAYAASTRVANEPGLDATVWRSTDGGASWKATCFGPHSWKECNVEHEWMNLHLPGGWFWGGGARWMRCCQSQPERIFFTNGGNGFISTNAGESWRPTFTDRISQLEYRGRGGEVLTCYHIYVDPLDVKRRWISYTDIGAFTSRNGGDTWIYAAEGSPWPNTCYEMAVDPRVQGRIYGAWSGFHDLPHFKMLRGDVANSRGGICVSHDHGLSWKPMEPDRQRPSANTILLDPESPPDARVLYAGFLHEGVWKSTDGGATWTEANRGLPEPPRRNVWRLVRAADGSLLCGITAAFPDSKHVPGGLFRSTDDAATWKQVGADQPFDWIFGVRPDPENAGVLYVSCFEVPPPGVPAMGTEIPWPKGNGRGGVYRTSDGGKKWTKILNRPYCSDVTLHPRRKGVLFVATYNDGVFVSRDSGRSFTQLDHPPFVHTQRVHVDPEADAVIWVTTFGGGVWKGSTDK